MGMKEDIQKICKGVEKIDKYDFKGLLEQIKELSRLKRSDANLFKEEAVKCKLFRNTAKRCAPILLNMEIKGGLSAEKMKEFLEVKDELEEFNKTIKREVS